VTAPFGTDEPSPFGRVLRAVRRGRAGAAVGVLGMAVVGACGGDGDDAGAALRPVIEEVAPAIAAVEAERGGPQRYFEVNATPQFVNLFVAGADGSDVTVYLYRDGELEPPTPPAPATGATFDAAAAGFDPDTILDQLTDDLPESDVVVFAITADAGGEPQFSASVQSDRGGVLDVTLAPDGTVLAVEPRA
jgi:hypothetical protein